MFNDPSLLKNNNFVCEATGLTHIVGHQDNLRPAPVRSENKLFNRFGGDPVQTDGRFIEQQHLWLKDQGTCKGDPLLFALGENPGRAVHEM